MGHFLFLETLCRTKSPRVRTAVGPRPEHMCQRGQTTQGKGLRAQWQTTGHTKK